jgi:tripartite-type tricarboxylate transporter receptor subunit TctC
MEALKFLAACACFAASTGAMGQAYPAKPVTVIVPFPPANSSADFSKFLAAEIARWKSVVVAGNVRVN